MALIAWKKKRMVRCLFIAGGDVIVLDSEQDVPESLPASAIPSVIPSSAIAPGGADPPPMQDPTVTSYTIDVSAPPVAPPGLR